MVRYYGSCALRLLQQWGDVLIVDIKANGEGGSDAYLAIHINSAVFRAFA